MHLMQVVAADSVTVNQEPRDTGTVLGVVQVPPQTIYRCAAGGAVGGCCLAMTVATAHS